MKGSLNFAILALVALVVWTSPTMAEVPTLLAWQGVALDSNSVPVTDSTYGFTFRIYDGPLGGALLWQESQLVTTENGVLNVLLGSSNPVPDSAFDGPSRYLEVQFGAEPPYTPRTQIVSVGYSYRVGSINGATGGNVTGSVNLVPDSSISGYYLRKPYSPNLAGEFTASPSGGSFYLRDANAFTTAYMRTDPDDGAGGRLTIYDSPGLSNGFFVYDPIPALSSRSLQMLLVGDSSGITLNSGVTGDASVILPTGAVDATEIRDEPGIASGVLGSGTCYTSYDTAATATITYPAPGYAVVICEATFRAYVANEYITANLRENGVSLSNWYWDDGDVDSPSPWYDERQTYVFTKPVSAGTYTYMLRLAISADSSKYQTAKVTVLYFPTAYGTVSTPTMTTNLDDPGAGQSDLASSAPLDVDADIQESVRFDQERIERELADMKERMARLELQLQQAGEAVHDER